MRLHEHGCVQVGLRELIFAVGIDLDGLPATRSNSDSARGSRRIVQVIRSDANSTARNKTNIRTPSKTLMPFREELANSPR
jgi:hypothetical protein